MPVSPVDQNSSNRSEPVPDSSARPDQAAAAGVLGEWIPQIEAHLDEACEFGPGCPARLGEAIRYAVLAPGKRLRPTLVLMAAEACGGTLAEAMPGAVAVEMIHAYSLIHDDLPAMDDDDLRRGRPTVHIQFDEATAILAGDALQPLALEHLCRHVQDPSRCQEAIRVLTRAAGPEHLVGGQADDLAAESEALPQMPPGGLSEGEGSCATEQDPTDARNADESLLMQLEHIHRRKTGALFAASLDLGAILAGANAGDRKALADYAADIGLAFQIVDDLLDHTADEAELGKRVGKDLGRGKLTYPGLLGLDGAKRRAGELIASAKRHVEPFGDSARRLVLLADFILNRSR